MATIERQLALPDDRIAQPQGVGQLVALVDALREGMLNPAQAELARQLRIGLLELAEREKPVEVVKVPAQVG